MKIKPTLKRHRQGYVIDCLTNCLITGRTMAETYWKWRAAVAEMKLKEAVEGHGLKSTPTLDVHKADFSDAPALAEYSFRTGWPHESHENQIKFSENYVKWVNYFTHWGILR